MKTPKKGAPKKKPKQTDFDAYLQKRKALKTIGGIPASKKSLFTTIAAKKKKNQ